VDDRIGQRVSTGPLTHRVSRASGRGALLVGDAAGFLNPFTGQGIFLAITSGRAAAATILSTLAHRSQEADFFREYDRLQKSDRRARARLSALLDFLAHAPPLARRIMKRLESNELAQNQLLTLFCGLCQPSMARGAALLLPMVV